MAPRGMSAEEKKAVVLDVFRAAEAPFAVKEIEKAAGAKKGLHPMQIKDLVVALVDDGKVGMRKPLTPPLPPPPPSCFRMFGLSCHPKNPRRPSTVPP